MVNLFSKHAFQNDQNIQTCFGFVEGCKDQSTSDPTNQVSQQSNDPYGTQGSCKTNEAHDT